MMLNWPRKAVELLLLAISANGQKMNLAYRISHRRFWIAAAENALTALPLLILFFVIVDVLPSGLLIVE